MIDDLVSICVPRRELEHAIGNRQQLARWNDVHVIGFDRLAVRRFDDRHPSGALEDRCHCTGVFRRKVRQQYERHSGIGRHCFQQLLQRFEPARGRTDADDRHPTDLRRREDFD